MPKFKFEVGETIWHRSLKCWVKVLDRASSLDERFGCYYYYTTTGALHEETRYTTSLVCRPEAEHASAEEYAAMLLAL